MVNSISNVPPAQNQHSIAMPSQSLQSKESVNDKVAVAQAKNEKKVKEEKDKKKHNSKRSVPKIKAQEWQTESIEQSNINIANIVLAQEASTGEKKVVSSAKASNAYNYFKNS